MSPLVIAHATEISGDDAPAFVHAGALAAASGARLVSVHGGGDDATRLPDAGRLASRWGRPIAQDRQSHHIRDDIAETVLDVLYDLEPALLVVGTHARHGVASVFRDSIAEALARNVEVPTLLVPNAGQGFVDPATGAIDLRTILVPASDATIAARGIAEAQALAALAGTTAFEIVVLHAGDRALPVTGPPGVRVRTVAAAGSPEEAIALAIRDHDPRVIVMPTHGHDGPRDALFGSHTEHVVRTAQRPVLSVPLGRA
jgi:nucleotide-binding universal stress UspA family protein